MNAGGMGAVFAIAVLDWYAIWTENEKLNWFTKPATMVALLLWLGWSGGFTGKLLWFGLALLFGLLGDIFLLLPRRFFIAGLVAFLIGHLAYVAGLWFNPVQLRLPHFIAMVLIGIVLALVAPIILKGMRGKDYAKKLRIPVLIYMCIISLMVFFATSTLFRMDWGPAAAGLAVSGAMLFFCSDIMLAYREFVGAFPKARFWVRVTYHLAQIALISAAVLNFAK
ncbi:MAG: lysoplasmalogenase [Anaerolineaceae bacterium]